MRFAMVAAAVLFGLASAAGAAEYMEKTDFQKSRAFSPGAITQGGRIVWLAGQTATRDEAGNDISGNFEAQVRAVFSLMDKTLHKAGGSLANLVTMTVFINDPRNGDRFVEIRRDTFKDGNYPGSALITVSNFARPGARCRHNEVYWANHAYFGFGMGAARYVRGRREVNTRDLRGYIRRALSGEPTGRQNQGGFK